jgi:hypothetical protein
VKNVRNDPNVTLTTKSGTTEYVAHETPVENRHPAIHQRLSDSAIGRWPEPPVCGGHRPSYTTDFDPSGRRSAASAQFRARPVSIQIVAEKNR